MRWWPVTLIVLGVTLGACSTPGTPGGSLAGNLDSVTLAEVPEIAAVALAPRDDEVATLELRFALERELARRDIALADDAPFRLSYGATLTSLDGAEAYLPRIALSGSIGSAGSNDFGVGIGLPLFDEAPQPRSYRFVIEIALEDRDGTTLWRGRAAGAARLHGFKAVAKTVAPLLIERIGSTVYRRPFSDRDY